MRLSIAASTLAIASILAVRGPASAQDFSITNPEETGSPARRNLMRQLQAWWDTHAYYPRHASNNDEGGTVKIHLVIQPDGRIWTVEVVGSSGSRSLDAAAAAAFRDVFVQRFPDGEPKADVDISAHYVLAHRHDEPVSASYTSVASRRPFTIMNDPVKSPILETMLERDCTGTVVIGGRRNYWWSGIRHSIHAIFFRKPDGTPWVKFDKGRQPTLAPVVQVGKMVQWTGAVEYRFGYPVWIPQYTAWPDGENHLDGAVGSRFTDRYGTPFNQNGGYMDLTCATKVTPVTTWNDWLVDNRQLPPGDPP